MKTYEITLNHDAGTITIRTSGKNIQTAIDKVCASEGCPHSAVSTWRVVPTKKQIERTKRMIASL